MRKFNVFIHLKASCQKALFCFLFAPFLLFSQEEPQNDNLKNGGLNSETSKSQPENLSEKAKSPIIYAREEFIAEFLKKVSLVDSLKYKIQMAEAEYDAVLAQYFPRTKLIFGVGPHPKYIYENAELLPDGNDDGLPDFKESKWHKYYEIDDYGIAVRLKGEFMLPVYTFGKIRTGRAAAKAQIETRRAEAEIGELKIRKEASLFYWSWVMAQDFLSLIEPALKQLESVEQKLNDMIFEEREGISQKDLIKFKIEKEKILYQYEKLLLQTETLKSVISEVLGDNWKLADETMTKMEYNRNLPELIDFMKTGGPQLKYMQNGLVAYERLYDLEVRKLLPDLGFAGSFTYKYTSSVQDKNYPLPNTPYNGYDGEIGFGLIFNLNILEQVRRVQRAKAEWNAVKAKAKFASDNFDLLLKRKCNDLKSLELHIERLKKIRKMAKGAMTTELGNYELGLSVDAGDLIDAVKAFFESEQAYIQTIFDYNMKVEEIIEFTGAR